MPENLQRGRAHGAREIDRFRRRGAKANDGVDDDREERDRERDQDLRRHAGAEPDDQDRRDRRLGNGLEGDQQRINRHFHRPRIDDQRAERQPDRHPEGKAEHEFEHRHDAHVKEHRKLVDRRRQYPARRRKDQRRDAPVPRRQLPDREQDRRGNERVEIGCVAAPDDRQQLRVIRLAVDSG